MPASTLAGSRIRARRTDIGMRQAELARRCDISASYLNLIEHNRRRIGGKLLADIARTLSVDPSALREGAESELVIALQAAAALRPDIGAEVDRTEQFAGRFAGWARLVVDQSDRIAALEKTVETLADRLTHDPYLSASLHDMLSTVTAIRSTSGILADDVEIPDDWQSRFHRNLYEDSQRLAETSQALVSYLDAGGDASADVVEPQDELEAWLAGRGFHIDELEQEIPESIPDILAAASKLKTTIGKAMAGRFLERYRLDARRIALPDLRETLQETGIDPARIAQRFDVDLPTAFRRLASLPEQDGGDRIGLVLCDGSGALTLRKPIDGFPVPRFGAACPLWPLYQAMSRPMSPVRADVVQPGSPSRSFVAYAICQPVHSASFDGPVVYEASMLVIPIEGPGADADAAQPIGTSCRICPRQGCPARREPSIISGAIS